MHLRKGHQKRKQLAPLGTPEGDQQLAEADSVWHLQHDAGTTVCEHGIDHRLSDCSECIGAEMDELIYGA